MSARRGGKWSQMMCEFDARPELVIVTADDATAARIRRDRPGRRVLVDPRQGRGAIFLYEVDRLPARLAKGDGR